jgi:hypothetical protein
LAFPSFGTLAVKLIFQVTVGLVIAESLSWPAACASRFAMKQIVIAHSTNVNATATNNKGAIVGTFSTGSSTIGFKANGRVLITLPVGFGNCLPQCFAVPTAINAGGGVAGHILARRSYGFLSKHGAYVNAGGFDLGLGGGSAVGPGLNNRGQEFYN